MKFISAILFLIVFNINILANYAIHHELNNYLFYKNIYRANIDFMNISKQILDLSKIKENILKIEKINLLDNTSPKIYVLDFFQKQYIDDIAKKLKSSYIKFEIPILASILLVLILLLLKTIYKNKKLEKLLHELKNNYSRINQNIHNASKQITKESKPNKSQSYDDELLKIKLEYLFHSNNNVQTYINNMITKINLLKQTILNEYQKTLIKKLETDSNAIMFITNNILYVSKIEKSDFNTSKVTFSLKQLIDNILSLIKAQSSKKNFKFEIEYDKNIDYLHGDYLQISHMLLNFINYLINLTNKGKIKIVINNINQKIRFKITNMDIELTQEEIENIFKLLSKQDMAAIKNNIETNLNLIISNELIKFMGGKMWIESEFGKKSSFIVEIPLPKVNIQKEENKPGQEIDAKRKDEDKILLIENNLLYQKLIQHLLKKYDIKTEIASNENEAVNMYKSNPMNYKLILIDLQPSNIEKYKIVESIRKISKNIPIIALKRNSINDMKLSKLEGINDYLNKPINKESLYKIISKYISQKTNIPKNQIKKEDIILPEFIHINSNEGIKHTLDNKKLYLQILNEFYDTYKDIKLEKMDDNNFIITTRSLKDLSKNIGAESLYHIAKQLYETRNKNLLSIFYTELDKVIQELKEKLPKIEDTKKEIKPKLTPEVKNELLKNLREQAQKRRSKLFKEILKKVHQYDLTQNEQQQFSQLQKLIEERKYNQIMELINEKENNFSSR